MLPWPQPGCPLSARPLGAHDAAGDRGGCEALASGLPIASTHSPTRSDSEYYKNFLIHYFENMDGKFVTVLNSYQTEFDTFDKSLLKILQNVIYDYYLQYNYIYEASEKLEKNEIISPNN